MTTSTTRIGDALICSVAGYVHMDNEQQLRHELRQALVRRPALLAIDLHAVDLFTTSALHTLLTARRAALAAGVPLVLAAPSPQAQRVLEITQTDTVFRVFPTLTEALHKCAPSKPDKSHLAAL
ncbi:STAS domain-containing protein [Kitasatospora sp. NPDC001175]|uniref:STAS domain-containing protein n=1 Tax=Kitasatospora sp. NPDC001175 TaxID=3157103 RepID=UPI003D06E5AC